MSSFIALGGGIDRASGFATFRTGVICMIFLYARWRSRGGMSAISILGHIVLLNLAALRLVNSMSSFMVNITGRTSFHLVMDYDMTRHIVVKRLLDHHSVLHCFTCWESCRIVVFHSMRALIAFTSAAWLMMIMVVYYCMRVMIRCLTRSYAAMATKRVGNWMRVMNDMVVMSVVVVPLNDLLWVWFRILQLELRRIWLWLLWRRWLVYHYDLFVFVVTFLFLLGYYLFIFLLLILLFLLFLLFFLIFA